MLDTVGPLAIIKIRSHLQNPDNASETPACCRHPCASWRKAIRKDRHSSQKHKVSHLPIPTSGTSLWSWIFSTYFHDLCQDHGWNPMLN